MAYLLKYDFPPGTHAYHTTSPENVESIRDDGICRDRGIASDTRTIETVIEELGYEDPFPFDRTTVVYCHLNSEYAEWSAGFGKEDTSLFGSNVVVVVSIEDINAPMYLADMGIVSDLIDYNAVGEEIMIRADSPEEAVQLYQEKIIRVEDADEIASNLSADRSHTELVIEGDIPPSAIVEIVRC